MKDRLKEPDRITIRAGQLIRATIIPLIFTVLAGLALLLLTTGCGEGPDTSAPERTVIERSAGWHDALLYIADANGPTPDWGSIRIYDNVSGFVETSVEQSAAASPVGVYVTPDGGSMYVAGGPNGRIDRFRWDGNNWIRAGITIDTPAQEITSIAPGPDGRLYVTGNDSSSGKIYRVNLATDSVEGPPLSFPDLADLRGIAWSHDGSTVYLAGASAQKTGRLDSAGWPSLDVKGRTELPGASLAVHPQPSIDERLIYVTAAGAVYKVDAASMGLAGTFTPSGSPATAYSGSALSADGKSMFVAGKSAGEDSTLYILDLASGLAVKSVKHISDTAGGIQRVE